MISLLTQTLGLIYFKAPRTASGLAQVISSSETDNYQTSKQAFEGYKYEALLIINTLH